MENNHIVPAVETLEKLASALEVPMYQLFHMGEPSPNVRRFELDDHEEWGMKGRDREYVSTLQKALGKMTLGDRNLLMHVVQKVAKRK